MATELNIVTNDDAIKVMEELADLWEDANDEFDPPHNFIEVLDTLQEINLRTQQLMTWFEGRIPKQAL